MLTEAFVPDCPSVLGVPPESGMNADALDRWSYVHTGSGVLMGLLGIPAGWTLAIASLYEVAEYAHEYPSGSLIFGSKRPESFANIATDMLLLMGGWWLGSRAHR